MCTDRARKGLAYPACGSAGQSHRRWAIWSIAHQWSILLNASALLMGNHTTLMWKAGTVGVDVTRHVGKQLAMVPIHAVRNVHVMHVHMHVHRQLT